MLRGRFSKEVTRSVISGEKVVVPPGNYHRGEVMTKMEAKYRRQVEYGDEVLGPALDEVERQWQEILDVEIQT